MDRSKRAALVLGGLLLLGLFAACRREAAETPIPRPPRLPSGEPAPAAVSEWVRKHAVLFRSEVPSPQDDDLIPIVRLLEPAQLVGLGEATHGTRQFFLMKHRLVQALATRSGFRTFLMEADGAGSCAIDDYLQGGNQDPRQLLRDLKFWTWNTQEFLDLLAWMRSYNRSVEPSEAIRFRGIDMQNPLALSRKVVVYLQTIDPKAAARAEAAYGCLGPLADHDALERGYLLEEPGKQIECAASLERVLQQISARLPPKGGGAVPSAASCALWSAKLLVQAERLLRFPSTRDHLYAETVLDLQKENPGERMILWAHNGHLSNTRGAMGRTVKRQLGDRYAIVGFTAYAGEFRARPRKPDGGAGPAIPIAAALPPADSYEAAFHRAGLPRFFLDLGIVQRDRAPAWLLGPRPLRDVGGAYDPELANTLARLPEEYDSLVFFDRGEASTLLSGR